MKEGKSRKLFILSVAVMVRAGSDQSHKPGNPCWSPTWLTGPQALGSHLLQPRCTYRKLCWKQRVAGSEACALIVT